MIDQLFKDTEIKEEDGILIGPFRKPFNEHLQAKDSIHEDGTAKQLGMRGGTISGAYHFEQFVPLFLKSFGQRWFETGGISIYFRYATTHLEPVQAFMSKPVQDDNTQADIWMKDSKENLVGEGTASMGNPTEPSALRKKLENLYPPGEVRILAEMSPGLLFPRVRVKTSAEPTRERFERITEPLEWYIKDSPWGGPILTPAQMFLPFRQAEMEFTKRKEGKWGVGLFGALEFRYINGPVFCDRDYVSYGKILAVGETPKTEYFWYECILEEPENNTRVAEGIILIRIMKASSALYSEVR